MTPDVDFERVVDLHYASLYRFAFSLTRNESDASDLVQQAFYIWATKGHQLHDKSKVKSWLFTTLHREYLEKHRKIVRFPQVDLAEVEGELPGVGPASLNRIDGAAVLQALARVEQPFQAPVALFYLEDYSYPEIAEILKVPLGTVKSRISRGIAQLQQLMREPESRPARKEASE